MSFGMSRPIFKRIPECASANLDKLGLPSKREEGPPMNALNGDGGGCDE